MHDKQSKQWAPQVQDSGALSLVEVMGALTMLGKKFKRFQDQIWPQFNSLGEQITFVDRKVSIGGEYDEPQV